MEYSVFAIGLKTPPANGQSLAFEVALGALTDAEMSPSIININENSPSRKTGSFTFKRVFRIITQYIQFVIGVLTNGQKKSVIYLNIGFSTVGFIRDALFIWTAKLTGNEIVIHAHGGGYYELWNKQPLLLKRFMAKTLGLANSIIVLDDFSIKQFKFVKDIDKKHCVVPNCLPKGIKGDSEAKSYNEDSVFRVLYMSNMILSKGYLDVLKAVSSLVSDDFDVHVDFCGQFLEVAGSDVTQDQAKANFLSLIEEDARLKERVTFHGFVSGEQKENLLKQAHVSVLPTYYVHEGQPLTIIEAMAYGTPVITTNYRGLPTLVVNGVNGFLVEPTRPEEIAERITRLINNPETYESMSRESIKRYELNHSTETYQRSIVNIVRQG